MARKPEYAAPPKKTTKSHELQEFKDLERSFTVLADDAQWRIDNNARR